MPGVDVAEELDPVDAEDRGGRERFGDAPFAERFVRRDDARPLLAELATRRDHEHDPVTVGLGPGHRAAARDLGVVGVGVEGHEGGGHDEHPDRTPRDMVATVRLLSQRET